MPRAERHVNLPDADAAPEADAAALADWIDAEPLPALEQYRQELADLAAQGQPDTEPVADRLLDVIAALNETGEALRDSEPGALPSALAAVLARCTTDIQEAQDAVLESRRRVEDAGRRAGWRPQDDRQRPAGA
ncbi:hypothetical protein [Patulibacter minatonensis]|uniref:hypothetical protein n=1 Tax=Patulibacter minatonensis TaxID=298163 RepID=UPI00047D78F9|nr:hypothetical protein [Patulibacter minatonensis]